MKDQTYSELSVNRKYRIPVWIKITTYIFIFITTVSLLAIPLSNFRSVQLNLYGIAHSSYGISLEMISISIISIFITIGLLGIISTKEWGPRYSIIIGLSLLTYFILRFIISAINGPIEIRLEPFLITLFLIKIRPINRNWNIKNV